MNRKIGIITFHRADNLGAVLQAYALQNALTQSSGADVEIINYRCPGVESTSKKSSGLKGLALKGYYLWKHWGFTRFRNRYLKQSPEYSAEEIRACAQQYDAFITGSDQVWNYECSGWDGAYFLDFVSDDKKKYSYAASIGNYRYTDAEGPHIRELLSSFAGISVREESARQELQKLGVEQVVVCPDPVILLEKECWLDIMPGRFCRQPYIFVYLIQQDVNVMNKAHQYAQEHHCRIINNKTSLEFVMHGSPRDFLSWIYHAECVFTNSFHGTAFAIIFNKPLAADIALANGGVNHRVKEMLEITGAQQCIIDSDTLEVNMADGEKALEVMRKEAFLYLKKIFTEP